MSDTTVKSNCQESTKYTAREHAANPDIRFSRNHDSPEQSVEKREQTTS